MRAVASLQVFPLLFAALTSAQEQPLGGVVSDQGRPLVDGLSADGVVDLRPCLHKLEFGGALASAPIDPKPGDDRGSPRPGGPQVCYISVPPGGTGVSRCA